MEDYIYKYLTKPALDFLAQVPVLILKFVVFLAIVIIGYVIGRIAGSLVRIFLGRFLSIEDILKEYKLENALYGRSLVDVLSLLARWWFYIYFISVGISVFGLDITAHVLGVLKTVYMSIGLFIFGLYVAEFVKNVIESSTIREKDTIKSIVKGVLIYIFFVLALQNVGIDAGIFLDILRYFALAAAISFGVVFGAYLILEHREDIFQAFRK